MLSIPHRMITEFLGVYILVSAHILIEINRIFITSYVYRQGDRENSFFFLACHNTTFAVFGIRNIISFY